MKTGIPVRPIKTIISVFWLSWGEAKGAAQKIIERSTTHFDVKGKCLILPTSADRSTSSKIQPLSPRFASKFYPNASMQDARHRVRRRRERGITLYRFVHHASCVLVLASCIIDLG
jgi:hypothetical protein